MATNTQVIQQAYAAFGRGDIAAVMALLADDVTWTSPRTLPHGGEFHGPAEVGKFFEGLGAAWDPLTLDVDQGRTGSATASSVCRAPTERPRGQPGRLRSGARLPTLTGGKIASFHEYVDIDAPINSKLPARRKLPIVRERQRSRDTT